MFRLDTLESSKNKIIQSKYTTTWDDFLKKVDLVPISILFSMASLESSNLSSRFAELANNIYGRHDLASCKLNVDCVGAIGSKVRLILYKNLADTIDDQVRYLNRHWAYKEFRRLRYEPRAKGNGVDGYAISPGLFRYSAFGHRYGDILRTIMSQNTSWVKYDNMDMFVNDPAANIILSQRN